MRRPRAPSQPKNTSTLQVLAATAGAFFMPRYRAATMCPR